MFSYLNQLLIGLYAILWLSPSAVETDSDNGPTNGHRMYEQAEFYLDTVAVGMRNPWGMVFLPGGDILVSERHGRISRIDRISRKITVVEGTPEVAAVGQGGLLDIGLHPDFGKNGLLYLAFSKAVPGGYTTAIGRARFADDRLVGFQELFEAFPAFSTTHHFGCRMVFSDGYLFFSVGDRGQMRMAQLLHSHNGKIMRLHDDGRVPSDNPFVAVPDARAEIWSYGHRNPQGLVADKITNVLWEHEHGPKGGDELNIIRKGVNYGWPKITFGIDYDGSIISVDTASKGMEQPVTYWIPSIAPCGMAVCHSAKYPSWKGDLFIGGLASRALFRLKMNGVRVESQTKMLEGIGRIRNVVLSPDGFVYVATESPEYIFRLMPGRK